MEIVVKHPAEYPRADVENAILSLVLATLYMKRLDLITGVDVLVDMADTLNTHYLNETFDDNDNFINTFTENITKSTPDVDKIQDILQHLLNKNKVQHKE